MNLSTETQIKQPAPDAPARKFMFERSFDELAAGRAAERQRQPVTLRPEQLEQLKKEAFDSGFVAGQKNQGDIETQRNAVTMTRVEEQLTRLVQNMQMLHEKQDKQLRGVVLSVIRKVLPSFMAKQSHGEIEAMLADIIGEMMHEPRLVVRVNEAQFDRIGSRVNEIATQKAYPGKVVVLADAEIAVGDCRVEWADGGIERKAAATLNAVEKVVAPEGMGIEAAAVPETVVSEASAAQPVETPAETPAAIPAEEKPKE